MTRDLITIDQLSISDINEIHNFATVYYKSNNINLDGLENKILINFFFENSTRTRISFEMAANRLGMKVINIDISLSSLKKGESIFDTARTINVMSPDFVVIRHNSSGIVGILKKYINASVINAGDGANEHPTQALLDSFVIKQKKGDLANLKIAICGDVLHSRVARSNIKLLTKFGTKINIVSLPTMMVEGYRDWLEENKNVKMYESLEDGIKDVDVIMMLRIQQERMVGCYIPSLSEYSKLYGLTHEKLINAKKDVLLMHPGPINRDVEISSDLADDRNFSLILDQVEAGVSVRQGLLRFLS